jgi:hypothetical protein
MAICASSISRRRVSLARSLRQFGLYFFTPDLPDPCDADRAHFLASVLYRYEEGRYSWEDRHVDLRVWLTNEPETDFAEWAVDKLGGVLAGLREANHGCGSHP